MLLADALTIGWCLWCPRAGQLWNWGVEPEHPNTLGFPEKEWFLQDCMNEDDDKLGDEHPCIHFMVEEIVIQAMEWPPLHVWIGASLFILWKTRIDRASIITGGAKLQVNITSCARKKLETAEKQLGRALLHGCTNRCAYCRYESLCRVLEWGV